MFALTVLALGALTLFTGSRALPASRADSTNPCESYGPAAISTAFNFTLTAYNATNTTYSNTSQAIVLTVEPSPPGQRTFGNSLIPLSKNASGSSAAHNFSLTNGTLTVVGNQSSSYGEAYINAGYPFVFEQHQQGASEHTTDTFCAIASTDPAGGGNPYPVLATNGSATNFSICPTTGDSESSSVVVYQAQSGNSAYNGSGCQAVSLHIVLTT